MKLYHYIEVLYFYIGAFFTGMSYADDKHELSGFWRSMIYIVVMLLLFPAAFLIEKIIGAIAYLCKLSGIGFYFRLWFMESFNDITEDGWRNIETKSGVDETTKQPTRQALSFPTEDAEKKA